MWNVKRLYLKKSSIDYLFGNFKVNEYTYLGAAVLILHVEDQITYEFLSRCGVKTFEDVSF